MRPLIRTSFAALACFLPISALAQQNSAEQHLLSARALYYTPTADGLKSFHCTAAVDWKDLLTRFSGKPIPDDNPFLVYLNSVHLSVTDDLNGKGTLEWADTATPSDTVAGPAEKIHSGMAQTLGGYFQAWNPFMNGDMVPVPDASTQVSALGDNIKLHATSGSTNVDEIFDKNLLLTSVHVVSPEMDATMHPTYTDSHDGRIISVLSSTTSQPPTAPPTDVVMSTTYTKISSFQIPSTIHVEVKNVGAFVFHFSACTVQTSPSAPSKP
jgi:hypothetical protein